MKVGNILLGAALGVGAIAAAPFTGGGSILAGVSAAASLTGAGTIAAAVGAAGAGAVIGAVASEVEEDEERERIRDAKECSFKDGVKKGEEQTKAKIIPIIKDVEEKHNYILALTAFGYATAYCDGTIAEEEEEELAYYLDAILKQPLPEAVKNEIAIIQKSKLSFNDVVKYLDKVEFSKLNHFSDVYEDIINADNRIDIKEKEFGDRWKEYYAKRMYKRS